MGVWVFGGAAAAAVSTAAAACRRGRRRQQVAFPPASWLASRVSSSRLSSPYRVGGSVTRCVVVAVAIITYACTFATLVCCAIVSAISCAVSLCPPSLHLACKHRFFCLGSCAGVLAWRWRRRLAASQRHVAASGRPTWMPSTRASRRAPTWSSTSRRTTRQA